MDRWLIYINEKFPQILWGSLAAGIAFSGNSLNGNRFYILPFILVFVGTWLFFFLVRLMNDYKDVDKDRLVNPDNPFARGLIDLKEARKVIFVLQIVLFAYSQLIMIALQSTASFFYIILAVYSWLYYNNFYIARVLERYPFVKIFFQYIFALPMAFFVISASQPTRVFGIKAWGFAIVLFGAFYVYDICRKLSPHSHPVLATPVHFYGYNKTCLVAIGMLVLSGVGAYLMGAQLLLWPMDALVLVTLIAVWVNSEAYKAPDLAATVSLLIHSWSGIL